MLQGTSTALRLTAGTSIAIIPGGCGVVFKLAGNQLTVLHSFKGPPDGDNPYAALLLDADGNLYGTTYDGGKGSNGGTVFKIGQDRQGTSAPHASAVLTMVSTT